MQAYVIRRVLALVPTLIFASLIVFITVRMIPGDVIDLMLSTNDIGADKKSREQLEEALGLNQPVYIQYFRWLGAILLLMRVKWNFHGKLGLCLILGSQRLDPDTAVRQLLHRSPSPHKKIK